MTEPTKFDIAQAELARRATVHAKAMPSTRQWTLVETLLWIALRDFEQVARVVVAWDDYFPNQFRGGSLADMVATYVEDLELASVPIDALIPALREGRISSTGLRMGNTDRAAIEPQQWIDLAFSNDPRGQLGAAGAFQKGRSDGTFWDDVRFNSDAVTAAFPHRADAQGRPAEEIGKRERNAQLEASAVEHLVGRMRLSPTRKPALKDKVLDEVGRQFGISSRALDRAWRNAIEQVPGCNWADPGPPAAS